MCAVCEIRKASDSPLGPTPEDMIKLVQLFATENGWVWADHSEDENIEFTLQSLFQEGYISVAASWAPDGGNTKYLSKYQAGHDVELSISVIPLDSLGNINPDEFMELAGKDSKAGVQYLIDKLGITGKVESSSIVELMEAYGLEVVSPEADSSDGEPN